MNESDIVENERMAQLIKKHASQSNEVKTLSQGAIMETQKTPTALPAEVHRIAIDKLHESPFNPRKRYGNLDEIAQSMKTRGVLQPITVRPDKKHKGEFEIVFGHRRYRAAKIAKLDTVPALVREMDDREAEETQLIENVQRVDVHPMEEAEALDALIKGGHKPDELATQVGKSKGHIYGRLKLLELDAHVRKMFVEDRIGYAIALLLARCPKDVQKKAADEIVEPFKGAEPLSFRQAAQALRNKYHVGLTDEYDPEAEQKRAEEWSKAVEKARSEKRRVLTDKELRDVYPYGTEQIPTDSPFVRLDMQAPADGKARNWKSVLGKNAESLSLVLAHDPLMGIHYLVDVKEANKLAKSLDLFEQKKEDAKGKATSAKASAKAQEQEEDEENDDEAKKAEREERRLRLRKATAEGVLSTIVEKIEGRKKFDRKFYRLIAEAVVRDQGMPPASLRRRGLKTSADLDFAKLNESQLFGLIFESLNGNYVLSVKDGYSDEIKQYAPEFGVDIKKVEDDIRDAEKAAAAAEREAEREKERAKAEKAKEK